MDWQAIRISILLSFLTSLVLLFVGIPLSYWLTRSQFKFKFILEAIIALPLVLPPTVLGFYVLIALGPRSPLGFYYEKVTGESLAFSFEGLLIASILYSFPFAVQPFIAAFSCVNRREIESSWCLGGSKLATFIYVVLPTCYSGILSGLILSFAHTLGEFGMVLMVGGNIPGKTRTVSVSIYDSVQSLDYSAAAKSSVFLLVASFIALSLVGWFRRKPAFKQSPVFGSV